MGIRVTYGDNAIISLGREAGQAQGAAEAAKIQAENDWRLTDHVIGTASRLAKGWKDRIDRIYQLQDQDSQRSFQRERDSTLHGYETQDHQNQQDFTAGENKLGRLAQAQEGDLNRKQRQNEFDAELPIRKAASDNQTSRTNSDLLNDQASREHMRAQAQRDLSSARLADARAGEEAHAQQQMEKQQDILLHALDAESKDPVTGEVVKDGSYLTKQAHILSGNFDKVDWQNTPSGAKRRGQQYAPTELSLPDAEMIALTNPRAAMKIAAGTVQPDETYRKMAQDAADSGKPPPPLSPDKGAVDMTAALGRVANLPQLTRDGGGPGYFTRMEQTYQQWRQADPGMTSPATQMLKQRVDEERMVRQETLLPRVSQQARDMAERAKVDAPTGLLDDPEADDLHYALVLRPLLKQNGITAAEYKQWAADLKARSSPFQLPAMQGAR